MSPGVKSLPIQLKRSDAFQFWGKAFAATCMEVMKMKLGPMYFHVNTCKQPASQGSTGDPPVIVHESGTSFLSVSVLRSV